MDRWGQVTLLPTKKILNLVDVTTMEMPEENPDSNSIRISGITARPVLAQNIPVDFLPSNPPHQRMYLHGVSAHHCGTVTEMTGSQAELFCLDIFPIVCPRCNELYFPNACQA